MKPRYLLLLTLLPLALALVISIPFIKADTPSSQQVTQNEMAELVEALKVWKLIDAVSPTSEQEVPLLTKFNKLEKLKTQYRREYRSAMDRLRQLQATPVDSEPKRVELQAALDHYREIEDGFITERKQIMEEIDRILSVEQQAKFVVFSYSYRQDLKKTLQTLIALQKLGDKGQIKALHAETSAAK